MTASTCGLWDNQPLTVDNTELQLAGNHSGRININGKLDCMKLTISELYYQVIRNLGGKKTRGIFYKRQIFF